MPSIAKHKNLNAVKIAHESIFNENKCLTPFQALPYCQVVEKFFKISALHHYDCAIYELKDDLGKTILILPLHIRITGNRTVAYLWGEFSQAGYLDAVYAHDLQADDLHYALSAISAEYPDLTFLFSRVQAQSRLSTLLATCLKSHQYSIKERPCVTIPMGTDYEAYLNSLSRHNRHKVHNSFNRLKNDKIKYEVKSFVNQPMPFTTLLRLFNLYWRRVSEKKINIKFRKVFPYFMRMWFNPTIIALYKLPNVYYSILYIEGALAGFCAGFTSSDGKVILPFLAIDTRFSRYSPGGILITSSIKHLHENHQFNYFDLSRGDESYKFLYGGVPHTNHDYEIRLQGVRAAHQPCTDLADAIQTEASEVCV